MRRLRCAVSVVLLWLGNSILQSTTLNAQSLWLEPVEDRALYLEILKPNFDDADVTFATSLWYLTGRYSVSGNLRIVAELPFAHVGIKDVEGSGDNTIGNPYAGVEFGAADSRWFGEFGVRFPLASDDNAASYTGALTDHVDRFEAFWPNLWSAVLAGNYKYVSPGGFAVRGRLAPLAWSDTDFGNFELWLLYSVLAWYDGEKVAAGGGLSGRLLATEDGDIGQRTLHQFGLFVNLNLGRWMPGVQLRVPLDEDLTEILDPVFSLSLGFKLR